MFKRKFKKGFASIMIGTMLLTQVVTPNLSNIVRAEGLQEETVERVEDVDNDGFSSRDDVAETSSEVDDSNKDMLSEDFQPMSEMTVNERGTALANIGIVPESAPSRDTSNNIERFMMEWRTQDDDGNASNLHNVWTTNEEQAVSYKMTYALSGQKDYAVGTVNIKVPKTIFKDRNGKPMGYTSFGVPKAPDNNGYFAYTEVEDGYVLTNTKRLKAASSGVIEATIKGLIPAEIRDFSSGYQSEVLVGRLTVTVEGSRPLRARTTPLVSDVDTTARVYGAHLKHNTEVSSTFPSHWDERLKPSNPDDYYYATFTSHASSQANQYFNVNLKIDMRASEDARNAVVLGYKNARKDELLLGDGTGVFDKEIESNVYLKDDKNFTGVIYVAYPKRDFPANRSYKLKGTVEYKMTPVDDKVVTTTTDEATLPFSPVETKVPSGNFYVEKQGTGDAEEWVTRLNKEGIYDTALNKLRDRQDVDIRFDIQTRAYGGAYTLRDGGDYQNINDYGHKPYKLVTDDFKTTFNDKGVELDSTDFEIKGLDLSQKPLGRKFVPLEGADLFENFYARRVFTAGDTEKPLFGYSKVDDSELPGVNIFGKVNNGGTWVQYGTVDYRSGVAIITPMNGATVQGTKLLFPSDVTDFKTEVETTLAHYVHDIQEIVKVKASDSVVSQVNELYKSGIAPKTYFANHVKLDVFQDGRHFAYINEFVGRDQLHGFAYGIKPEKTLVSYENDTSKRKVDLTYELSATIQTNLLQESSVQNAITEGWLKEQKEGVFYDLLPKGVIPITSTVTPVRKGDSITSVRAIENYKGSGRTLLEIKTKQKPDYKYEYKADRSILDTKGYYDKPAVRFKARLSWLNLKAYGAMLPNIMAYGSKDVIDSVKGLGTEESPTTGKNTFTKLAFSNDEEKAWLGDLDFDGVKNFVYARKDSELVVDTNSVTSVLKEVDVNNENLWGDGLDESLAKNVYEGGRYSYAISMKNTDITKTKDIVFYDNLEKFKPFKAHDDYGDMQWRGTYQDINLDALRKMGVEPVVYYSTKDNLVLDNDADRSDLDLTNTAIWTKELPADKTKIRAIAIDARKKVDGGDFVLPANGELHATVQMRAPLAPSDDWYDKVLKQGEKETGLVGGGHAYNNVVMTSRQISVENGVVSDNLLVRHDYVKVGLKPYKLKVTKEWDDDGNRDGLRQKQATFELLANGKPTNKTVTVSEDTQWSGEFGKVPYLDDNGMPISYTVIERNMKGYTLKIKDVEMYEAGVNFKVTNKHDSELINIKGEKVWEDKSDLKRPESITVTLKADGREIRKAVVTPRDGKWNYEFKELYKYRDGGTEIKYTVEEKDYITGYVQEIKGFDIVNTYDPYADVVLTKRVEAATDKAKEVNPDFTFVFNLKDKDGNPVMKEYDFETTLGRTGKIYHGKEFTLKMDEEIKIKRVDSDNTVTFKEVNYPSGYSLVSETNTTETLQAGRTMRAVFTNKYETKGVATLNVSKELSGRAMFPYEFRFSLLKDDVIVRTGGNTEDGRVNFGLLEFTGDALGKVHNYKIREENTGRGGIQYDLHEEDVRIDLVDNGKGEITANVTYDADGAKFKNEYHAKGKVNFKVWKQILNGFKPENEQFSFELVDENNQVVAAGKNDASGTVTFSDVNFTEKDVDKTLTFTAREVQGTDERVVYDASTITYKVEVKDNYDGTLSLKTSVRDNKVDDINNDINSPVFVNKYKDGKLTIRKKVTNGNPNKEFRFRVKLKGADGVVPKGKFEVERNSLNDAGVVSQKDIDTKPVGIWSKLKDSVSSLLGVVTPKVAKAVDIPDEYKPQGAVVEQGEIVGAYWKLYENGHLEFSPRGSGQLAVGLADDSGVFMKVQIHKPVKSVSFKQGVKAPSRVYHFAENFSGELVECLDLSNLDVSGVTNMSAMFEDLMHLKILNLGTWDTSKVTDMSSMFNGTVKLERLDLSNFNTSKVKFMHYMFARMERLKELNVSSFDTSKVLNMFSMFSGAINLERLDVSNFDTSRVTSMEYMFAGLMKLEQLDVSRFDTSKTKDMAGMFQDMSHLKELNISNFNTSNVTDMGNMFNGVSSLEYLDVSRFDTFKVRNLQGMFRNMSHLKELNVSNFNTSNVTDVAYVFDGTRSLKKLDVSTWSLLGTTRTVFAQGMFSSMVDLEELILPSVIEGNVGLQAALKGTSNLRKIVFTSGVGSNHPFRPEMNMPVTYNKPNLYTGNWVREDKAYGPALASDLNTNWQVGMAGTWVREKVDQSYTVKFNTQGTGEEIPQIKVNPDEEVELPTPTIRKPGTKFKGWAKAPAGDILTTPVVNLTANKGTITLYAIWEEVSNRVNIENGEFEVSVIGNEQVTLKNLPAGLSYEVYELTTEGWVLVDENNTTGVIKPNEDTIATFTNEYRPGEAQAKLQAKKLVDGKAANAKGYRFELVKDGNVLETVESTEDGTINFKNIRYNETGTFNYTIREVNDNKVGISYDTSVKNVSVVVTDLGNGKRQAEVKYEGDRTPVFNNTTQKTTLEVSKVVQGTEDATKDFNFKVTINDVEQVFTLKNGDKKVIEGLKVGDTYKVEEVNLPDAYSLVSITNAEGTIGSTQPVQVVATNKYNVNGSVELQAKKVLSGKELVSGQFTFELINSEGVVVDTAKNDAKGNVYFNAIELTQAGVLNYKVREVKGSEDGVTYDAHEENVRVVVTDNGNGSLTPKITYDADGAVFTNVYTPPVVPPSTTTSDVTITKKVEGTVTSRGFNVKVEVLKDGKLLENTFNYTSNIGGREGTLVSGNKLEIKGNEVITLSGVPVGAIVKITEDEYKGYHIKDGSVLEKEVVASNNDLVLTNVYEANGQVTLEGTKTLVGGDLGDYRFKFLVLKDGKLLQEVTHTSEGKLEFQPLYFTNKDIGQTYEYEVVEDVGNNDGIDYDSTVYKVTVQVEDNGDGTLKLTTTTSGDNGIVFKNVVRSQLPLTGTDGVLLVLSSLLSLLLVGAVRRRDA